MSEEELLQAREQLRRKMLHLKTEAAGTTCRETRIALQMNHSHVLIQLVAMRHQCRGI